MVARGCERDPASRKVDQGPEGVPPGSSVDAHSPGYQESYPCLTKHLITTVPWGAGMEQNHLKLELSECSFILPSSRHLDNMWDSTFLGRCHTCLYLRLLSRPRLFLHTHPVEPQTLGTYRHPGQVMGHQPLVFCAYNQLIISPGGLPDSPPALDCSGIFLVSRLN